MGAFTSAPQALRSQLLQFQAEGIQGNKKTQGTCLRVLPWGPVSLTALPSLLHLSVFLCFFHIQRPGFVDVFKGRNREKYIYPIFLEVEVIHSSF